MSSGLLKSARKLQRYFFLFRKTFLTDYIKIHFSQFGEDIILKELIKNEKKNGFYVDVGCYHPKKFSNTYMLYKKGWDGINIDMEEEKIRLFRLARPKDHNVVAAVSDRKETVKLYRFSKFGLGSTIDEEYAKHTKEKVYAITEIQTNTLNEIIEGSPYKGRQIDLLTIDAEGNDLYVLKSLDIDRYKPKIIIIEEHSGSIDDILISETYMLLKAKGYMLCSWVHFSLIFKLTESDLIKEREKRHNRR